MCLDPKISAEAEVHVRLMTDLSHKKMVFLDTLFFICDVEIKRLQIVGQYCFVLAKYFRRVQMGRSKSSSMSLPTKSPNDGTVNSSNQGSGTEGFRVLATKSGR